MSETSPVRLVILFILLAAVLTILYLIKRDPDRQQLRDPPAQASVEDRLDQYGPSARARIQPAFAQADVTYPPARLLLLALKSERRLDIYAAPTASAPLQFITAYRVLGASGVLGPKLREGDRQVPEGFYRIVDLNPNSRFHLSLRVNYPNDFDLAQANRDGRAQPGSDIMIHGSDQSIGCLAIGDPAAEDLFVLAADVGLPSIDLLIAPHDYRTDGPTPEFSAPDWMQPIYENLRSQIRQLPLPSHLALETAAR